MNSLKNKKSRSKTTGFGIYIFGLQINDFRLQTKYESLYFP